ncbi:MAG: methionine--tRNA ligase [Candidatus Omnitrophica bacterium]|nr:methionine--tRNA ligase [Candidatus Omnitrophota bacterium]
MASKFYITTPIYYVNAAPHIGHSYTTIAADTLARYHRLLLGEKNVRFLTGTDEHGQKIQRAAEAAGLSPLEFTDTIVPIFKKLWEKLNISYDDFIRTSEDRHVRTVQRVLSILKDKGEIYPSEYEGWYCTPCETFWMEKQLEDGKCPDCKRPVEKIKETNYFFKLSAYQDWLTRYIYEHPGFVKPASRYEEVVKFLELNKLNDLCISRPSERLSWGIPFPFSPEHVTYVWFDALINYISAAGDFDENGLYRSEWWQKDAVVVHLIGKDILRQHAVYWPIMLKALGIRLPDTVFAHGWWMVGEDKMSKSRGNVISPLDMVDKYGLDVYRYFLLRDVPFGLDGSFSEESLVQRFNGDLANDLGNLVYRTLTMIEKYFDGRIPVREAAGSNAAPAAGAIDAKLARLSAEVKAHLAEAADYNFGAALESIWEAINMANKYVEETKPWNLSKEGKLTELKDFIAVLVDVIRHTQEALSPFMPSTCASIRQQAGSHVIKKGNPLFPRIDTRKPSA